MATGQAIPVISRELMEAILAQYPMSPLGIHGVAHWARVLENGRRLATLTGADLRVVELFAALHDARRKNEGEDYIHGPEGAELAKSWRGRYFRLEDTAFEHLYLACEGHTDGQTLADVTVQTCWDADRLDLGRAGIRPAPDRLCTPAAQDPGMIAWAESRSRVRVVPDLVKDEWGIDLKGAPGT